MKVELAQEHVTIGHLEGHLHPMFRWSIEFDRILGRDELTLSLRHWIERENSVYPSMICAAGNIVSISVAGKGLVYIVLEDDLNQRWVKICLPLVKFSSLLNLEWIAQGEVSVATTGLFSKWMTVQKFLAGTGILPVELVYGFQYVKTYMLKNPLTVEPLRTWKVQMEMHASGVFKLHSSETISPIPIFVKYFDMAVIKEFIAQLIASKKAKRPSTTESNVVQKKKK